MTFLSKPGRVTVPGKGGTMTYKFIISGRLPGLNEYTEACRTNKHKGNKMKQDAEDTVI